MKTIRVKREEIHPTAAKLAAELGGKMYSLKGTVPGSGKTRGIAVLPAGARGSQSAVKQAVVIVTEA